MSHHSNANLLAEIERLRQANVRITSTVQELRLEITYYQGEAKKNEWEKELVKQELKNVTTLFKSWANEVRATRSRHIFDDPDLIAYMAGCPTKPIAEFLQLGEAKAPMLFITCEEPFTVEVSQNTLTHTTLQVSHFMHTFTVPP